MFNTQEYQALLVLLDRVDIKGSESEVVSIIKQKIRQALQPKPNEAQETKEAPAKEGKGK